MRTKAVLDRNKITMEDPGMFNKTIILLGLAGYKMITTNLPLRNSLVTYHFISRIPSKTIVEYMVINGNTW